MANYTESFDEIRNKILIDYRNVAIANGWIVDIAPGSHCYNEATVMAAQLWKEYQYLDFVRKEILPTTCSSQRLKEFAAMFPLRRTPTETDSDVLAALLKYYRNPLAGGNRYDYIAWAEYVGSDDYIAKKATLNQSIEYPVWDTITDYGFGDVVRPSADYIDAHGDTGFLYMCLSPHHYTGTVEPVWPATIGEQCSDDMGTTFICWAPNTFLESVETCFYNDANPPVHGAGTVDVVITSNYNQDAVLPALRGFPSQVLIAATKAYIEYIRALTNYEIYVYGPSNVPTTIAVVAPGTDSDILTTCRDAIIALLRSFTVGKTLTRDYLVYIIISNGITDFTLSINGSTGTTSVTAVCGDTGHLGLYERLWPYNSDFSILTLEANFTVSVTAA